MDTLQEREKYQKSVGDFANDMDRMFVFGVKSQTWNDKLSG